MVSVDNFGADRRLFQPPRGCGLASRTHKHRCGIAHVVARVLPGASGSSVTREVKSGEGEQVGAPRPQMNSCEMARRGTILCFTPQTEDAETGIGECCASEVRY